ncbi:hypothetical protein CAEBREN_02694 [Caenorhabditis brenneri]|uniref:Uncharacterized protein n=1 Tax=Caenorhabditis brenneri TaxID=135651 RepID=G0M782_CAEBE|nr:hypothetical protein CAEBREN_02694 [Caenorhabditis brenneri]
MNFSKSEWKIASD